MSPEAIIAAAIRAASNIAIENLKLLAGAKDDIDSLTTTLNFVRRYLDDASSRQHESAVKLWLHQLQAVAFEAEDVFDELATDSLRRAADRATAPTWLGPVGFLLFSCFSCLASQSLYIGAARRIKAIRESLDSVVREGERLKIQESIAFEKRQIGLAEPPAAKRKLREATSLGSGSDIVGRVEERGELVDLLLSPCSDAADKRSNFSNSADERSKFSIVAIVGMGGLGKTTLAQLVYNDPQIENHFQVRMWAQVSQNSDPRSFLGRIIESATEKKPEVTSLDSLKSKLKKLVKDQLFLLVLDDVWDEEQLWESLRAPLGFCRPGSRIIVTTRSHSVVAGAGAPTSYIGLGVLPFEDCWAIFQSYAVVDGTRLQGIAKEIVEKARGVPMAVKALGGLLRNFGFQEKRWRKVLETEISQLREDDVDIVPILKLSYQHLPPHLKQCFAYCALFPKGFIFDRSTLIRLWMALGFVQCRENEQLEDVGGDCFDALLRDSFFQNAQGGGYMMHDFMHAVAVSVSENEYFRVEKDGDLDGISSEDVRHLSLSSPDAQILQQLHGFSNLRSLLFLRRDGVAFVRDLHNLFKKLTNLRVLDMSLTVTPSETCCGTCYMEFPDSIFSLKHLRYLHLSIADVTRLPESLGTLYNLQTLKLEQCKKLEKLPEGISKLVKLRRLETDANDEVYRITGIGKLTELQELKVFSVGRENGRRIEELKDMMQLEGSLSISKLENVRSKEEAEMARLAKKENIEGLEFGWGSRELNMIDPKLDEQVLEGLRPNSNLKDLAIKHYGGVRSPSWMQEQELSFLEIVRLIGCRNWKVLPALGQLPFLKVLELNGVDGGGQVQCFQFDNDDEYEGMLFPCLHTLNIWSRMQLFQFPQLPPTVKQLRIDTRGFYVNFVTPENNNSSSSTSLSLPSSNILRVSDPADLAFPCKDLLPLHLWAITELTISNCEALVTLPVEGFEAFVSLRVIQVISCPKLRKLPPLPCYLTKLRTCESGLDILPEIASLEDSSPCLSNLEISRCPNLESLCEGMLGSHLPSLKDLVIEDCSGLVSMPSFETLVSLKSLIISACPKLRSLPSLPPTLKYLSISKVGLIGLPEFWTCASTSPSLWKLEISSCEDMASLCEGLLVQELKALEELFICDCKELESLPGLGGLESLQILTVVLCPRLVSTLPNDLPVSLQKLEIDGCPRLMEQFSGEEGCNRFQISCPRIRLYGGRWYRPKLLLSADIDYALNMKRRAREQYANREHTRGYSGRRQARLRIFNEIFESIAASFQGWRR